MKAICISAAATLVIGLTGCETILSEGLGGGFGNQWAPVVRSYAGQPVPRSQPRSAYQRMDGWQRREVTGYQQFGPYVNRSGQPYVMVRRFYSDGSYEDSPQLVRTGYRQY